MEHQDQRGAPADRVGQQAGQPQRSVGGESLAQHIRCNVEQFPVATRWGPFPVDQMPVEPEVRVVDPDGSTAADRDAL